jgi:hypothetical protein
MTPTTRFCLIAGIALPICYYGAQIIAAPFFPDFSFLRHTASALGSNQSTRPEILNLGAMLTGVLACITAWGLFAGVRAIGVSKAWLVIASLFALCTVSFGASSIWAGWYPLPDPRHNPGALGAGIFAAPFVAFILSFALPNAMRLRTYHGLNIIGFAIVAMIYAQVLPVNLELYAGAVQRGATLVMLLPFAVISAWLLQYGTKTA